MAVVWQVHAQPVSLVEEKRSKSPVKKQPQLKLAPVPPDNMGKEWKAVRYVNGVFTYRLKKSANTIGVFHTRPFKKDFKWTRSQDLFQKIMDKKKAALSLLNITDWSIANHSWKKKKTELTVEGSYKTPDGDLVFFKELHYFKEKKIFQVLITSQDRDFLNTDASQQFFNRAKAVLSKGA